MRNQSRGLIYTAVLFILCSCRNDFHPSVGDIGESVSDKFPVGEARAYFENTAENLCMVHIGCGCGHEHHAHSKATAERAEFERNTVITPDWSAVRQTYDNGRAVTLEVPLRMRGQEVRIWSSRNSAQDPGAVRGANMTAKLILQKHIETGHMRYFIATFIPDSVCLKDRKNMKIPFNFMRDADYSGYVIVSDVNGNYRAAFRHRKGYRQRVEFKRVSAENPTDESSEILDKLHFSLPISHILTKSGDSESGGGIGLCPFCNSTSVYGVCPNKCEVTVVGHVCSQCGRTDERCICCKWCNKFPCECNKQDEDLPQGPLIDMDSEIQYGCLKVTCPFRPFCNGGCLEAGEEKPPQEAGGAGGGTGGGSGGTTPPIITSREVAITIVSNQIAPAILQYEKMIQSYLKSFALQINVYSLKIGGKIQPFNDSITGKPVRFRIGLDEQLFNDASAEGKAMLLFHEICHMIFFHEYGYNINDKSKYNEEHHQRMIDDPRVVPWLRTLFPKFSDEEIENYIKYAGTEDSSVFKRDCTKSEQEFAKLFCHKNGIVFSGSLK